MRLRDAIQHYAHVIQKRLWLISVGVGVCSSVTLVVSLFMPPVYQAAALVLVDGNTISGTSDIYSNQALAFSYALLVTKDDVLQAAAQQLPGMTASKLRQVVSDTPITNTPMIEIRARAAQPQQAALIVNTVARAFIRIMVLKANVSLQSQESQLAQNLQDVRVAVDAAQTKLTTMQSTRASNELLTFQRSILDTEQANYTALLDSYHHLQQRELQTPNELSIAQLATVPEEPVSLQPIVSVGISALLSLLIMLILVLLLDWADETIKTEEDVVHLASLEALGSVPFCLLEGSSVPTGSIIQNEAIEEAFVAISTALTRLCAGKRSLLVTGVRAQSGVSTTAANLAIALARSGLRVLLIDANLRNPILHKAFKCFHTQTLVSCLVEIRMHHKQPQRISTWLNQWRTHIPQLWLLPAGPVSSQPATLLSVPELGVLVQELLSCRDLDLLIFDTSSLDQGADVLAVAALAEATILVVDAGKEQRADLLRAKRLFARLGSPIVGAVVNRKRKEQWSYFYAEQVEMEDKSEGLARRVQPAVIAAQAALPDTPRPPVLTQELLVDLLKQPAVRETPPALVQITASEATDRRPRVEEGKPEHLQPRSQPPLPLKHMRISLPGLPRSTESGERSAGLKYYQEDHK